MVCQICARKHTKTHEMILLEKKHKSKAEKSRERKTREEWNKMLFIQMSRILIHAINHYCINIKAAMPHVTSWIARIELWMMWRNHDHSKTDWIKGSQTIICETTVLIKRISCLCVPLHGKIFLTVKHFPY